MCKARETGRHRQEARETYDVAVLGSGPAGLMAAIEASRRNCRVLLIDENFKLGGQLFKQIHKFFGSSDHFAGTRGFRIGEMLAAELKNLRVETSLNTTVIGIFDAQSETKRLAIATYERSEEVLAKKVVVATGAIENVVPFPGWTIPGVMGVGAAQTLMNIFRVPPGKRSLIVGAGNVGLIVAYQMLQAGIDVAAIVEAMPRIGGYGVHAAKILRMGVPILLSHTIRKAIGTEHVEKAVITEVNKNFKQIRRKEKTIDVDIICFAVGLTPNTELTRLAGCEHAYAHELGGWIPLHDNTMETTVDGIYVAGDLAGIEEASVAIDGGKLAGVSAAEALGFTTAEEAEKVRKGIWKRLNELRSGPFGEPRRKANTRKVAEYRRKRENAQ